MEALRSFINNLTCIMVRLNFEKYASMFRRLQIRKDLFISYFIFPVQIVIFIHLSFFSVLRYLTFLRISNHSFLHVHPHIIEYFFPLQNLNKICLLVTYVAISS